MSHSTTTSGSEAHEVKPARVPVGRFTTYREAKRAVDTLRVARIPERRITVLGRGLRWNPPITGGRAAQLGTMLGAAVSAVTVLVLWGTDGLSAGFSWFSALFTALALGGAAGLLLGVAMWRATRDTGQLPETGSADVERYDVLVDRGDAGRARELLDS
jgi:hypothetical protein